MKTKGSKSVHYEAGPNMTPLVDVVMVILIFLMLAGKFGSPEHFLVSTIPLGSGPGDPTASNAAVDEPIKITVDSVGGDRFLARAGRVAASDGPTLTAALAQLRTDLIAAGKTSSDIQVRIAPGHAVKYEHVLAVQEAAMNAKFEKIGFATAH